MKQSISNQHPKEIMKVNLLLDLKKFTLTIRWTKWEKFAQHTQKKEKYEVSLLTPFWLL